MVNENLYVHTKYSMRSEGTIIQCGTVNALRFFQAEVVIDFYLVAVLPHLALKTPNHFETRVWRHLPQWKALMASDTSVKRRCWNSTTDSSASDWVGAVQRLRGDSCLNKWMLEFPWSCNPFCSSVILPGIVLLQHCWWNHNVNWMISDTPKSLAPSSGVAVLPGFVLNKALWALLWDFT